MYNCIIFDVDGTLVDTEQAVVSSYQRVVLEELGRRFTPEELARNATAPTKERLAGYGVKNIEEALKKLHAYLMEAYCNVKAYEGILKVLEQLDGKNITVGIVTARFRREVEDDQCLQGLIKHFKYVICADDTKKHKPDPEPLMKIINMAGAQAAGTIYIGDMYSDYMCAKAAGVHFGLALWGAKSTEGIDAQYNFKSPEEILYIL